MKERRLALMSVCAILLPTLVIALVSFITWDITMFDLSDWIPPARFSLLMLVIAGAGIGSGISDTLGFESLS